MKTIDSILRQATRDKDAKLNILCNPIHEGYQSLLAETGHNFYLYQHPHCKNWSTNYRPLPDNFIILDQNLGDSQIPNWVDFDLVLIESVFGHYQFMKPIADRLGLPTVRLEHTTPTGWSQEKIEGLRPLMCDVNLFITNDSRQKWLFDIEDGKVIKHGIDTDLFQSDVRKKENHILCVANDWVNRGYILGFDIFQQTCTGLPVKVIGQTEGLSVPAGSTEQLIDEYQKATIFLNTSRLSPIPMSILEAASCGAAIVSTETCAIPDFFTHEENAFLTNDAGQMRQYLELLLNDKNLAIEMGQKARKMVEDKCNKTRFLQQWNDIFAEVTN